MHEPVGRAAAVMVKRRRCLGALLAAALLTGMVGGCSSPAASPVVATAENSVPPPSPSASRSPTPSAADLHASVGRIGPDLRARMRFSHHRGCPVAWRDLRYLRVPYVGFDARPHLGELVVHKDFATDVTEVFLRLYAVRWPIQRMRLVDDFGADDDRSMAANNTSAYNCRLVAGRNHWSAHSFGAAIDINPVQNPYVTGPTVAPATGQPYAAIDRSAGATVPDGAVAAGDIVTRAFARIGWGWGGDWSSSKDYQHFSATGR